MAFVFPNVIVDGLLNVSNKSGGIPTGKYLTIDSASGATADSVLTFDTNDVSRTVDLSGNMTIGGAFTTAGAFTTTGGAITLAAPSGSSLTLPAGSGTVATTSYVDGVVQGLDVKQSVRMASALNANWTTNVLITFSSPTLTLSALSTGGALGLIDSVEPVVGNRILIKDAGAAFGGAGNSAVRNGIWVVTGGTTTTLTLIRATDADDNLEVTSGLYTFVEEGTVNADSGWVLSTNDPLTIGTTPLTFTQFSGAGQIVAGDGIDKSANTISVKLDTNSGLEFNATALRAKVAANSGIIRDANGLSLDLGASAITGTLAIGDGGTGATTLEGANIVTQSIAASNADFIPVSAGASRAIKTTTVSITSSNNLGGVANFTATGTLTLGSGNTAVITTTAQTVGSTALTIPNLAGVADTFTFNGATQSLSNKTLIDPRINNKLLDNSGNELIIFPLVGSAVNEFTISNAATGTNPSIAATGGDANIGIDFAAKGTGKYRYIGTSAAPAELQLFEDTDNGTNYVGLAAPSSVTAQYTLSLPSAQGAAGQVMQNNGSGALSWVSVATATRRSFSITGSQINAFSGTAINVAYFPWLDSLYGDATTLTLIIYANSTATNGIDVAVTDGTTTVTASRAAAASPASAVVSASVAYNPNADKRLVFSVARTGGGTSIPSVQGIVIELS